VELDPTVPSVMSWFYSDASRYLHSPLGHIIISDGRNYVRLANKHYDLITVDAPPPLWGAAAVVLLTHEFYQEVRQRLRPGGVLASFIPYSGRPSQQMYLRTFRATFRYMTVIRSPRYHGMYVLGSQAPMVFRASAITAVFGSRAARADLASAPDYGPVPTTSWPGIIQRLVWLTNGQVDTYSGPGPMLTDDHPLSEYFLIRDLGPAADRGSGKFERPALQLALVVTILLGILACGVVLETLWRPTRRVGTSQP